MAVLIGLISDTHGLLRPEAVAALSGVDLILHAGDVGKPEILATLAQLAPLHAVRGNNDVGLAWARDLPDSLDLTLGGLRFHLLHDFKQLKPPFPPADVYVAGHSHKPLVERRDGGWWINPGSAGPRRFKLPVTLALMSLEAGEPSVSLVSLLP